LSANQGELMFLINYLMKLNLIKKYIARFLASLKFSI